MCELETSVRRRHFLPSFALNCAVILLYDDNPLVEMNEAGRSRCQPNAPLQSRVAGDELPGEWIRMRRSLIPSLFLLPRGDLTDDTRADQDPQRGEGRLKDFLRRL
ncbi:hypothetical protein Q8A67_023285 [Cirrhinus molitorella]|uniref:Uncharacterized protein n=1 Tax=Cirrhinus molitorella TaxID=172907 RepID=A0AA88TE61_9TELE|nr:hypothetical protein Q8A67_023285 [Cirrhinus molitorella]